MSLLSPSRLYVLPAIWRYILAILMVVAAAVLRKALIPVLGTTSPYGIVLATQVMIAIFLGIGPGLAAVVLGNVTVEVFVLGSLPMILEGPGLARLAVSLAVGAFIVWLLHAIRVSAARVRQAGEFGRIKGRLEELVAERTQAWQENARQLRQTQDLLEAVTTGTKTLIAAVDRDFRYTYFTPEHHEELKRLTGRETKIGMSLTEVLADMPEEREQALKIWERALNGETVVRKIMFGDPTRYRRWYKTHHAPIRGVNGEVIGAGEVTTDISELMQAEEDLRESEERMQQALLVSRSFTFEWNPPTDRVVRSASCAGILKLRGDEAVNDTGRNFFQRVHPDDRGRFEQMLGSLTPVSSSYVTEYRVRCGDGSFAVLEEVGQAGFDAAGALVRLIGVTTDITQRRTAEAALQESEGRLRALNETSPIGVGVSSTDGVLLYTNPAYESMLGYGRGELLGQKAVDLYVNSEDRSSWLKEMKEGRAARNFEAQLKRKDGLPVWVSINTADICYGGKQAVIGTIQDITERRRSEELRRTLAEQENLRLGAAVEQASDAVVMIDLDGTIRYVNAAFESINRISPEEAVGTCYFDLLAGEPAAAEAVREAVAAGRPWHRPLTRAVRGARPVELEVTVSSASDPSGTVIGGLITEKDVTRENALQNQVRQAQKMEALGTLAGGITHDFNNILGTIVINTELALLDLDPQNPARQTLPFVLRAANRGKELVKQIITFSRQRTWERKPLEIAPIVKEGLKLLRTTLPKDIAIQEAIDSRSGVVMADPSHINQVLVNLCQNAALAMKEAGGRLAVTVVPVEVDEAMAVSHPNLKPGPYTRLTVSDTGCGMTKEVQERIFEPFFTTRSPGEGTGLGLAVVHGIVRTYDGEITVASEPGKGSTFNVYLPRLAGETPAAETVDRPGPQRGEERILLVEDERAQRESLERGLGRLGYRITARADGQTALAAFRTAPAAFDLVITDQVMPGMTGLDLASAVSALRPDVPIILCTGFSERVNRESLGRNGVRELIMKPYTIRDLTALIRKVAR